MRNPKIISVRIIERLSGTNFLIKFDLDKERTRVFNPQATATFVESTLKSILPGIDLKRDYTPRVLEDDFTKVHILNSVPSIPNPQAGRRMDYMTFGDIGLYVYHYNIVPANTSRLTSLIDSMPIPTKLFNHLLQHLSEEEEIALFSKGYTIGRTIGISNP